MSGEPAPYQSAFWVGRICEEFHCDPLRAERIMAQAPVGWIEDVLEARHYADAYFRVMGAAKKSDVPSSPMVDLVRKIDMEQAAEAYRAKQQREAGRG